MQYLLEGFGKCEAYSLYYRTYTDFRTIIFKWVRAMGTRTDNEKQKTAAPKVYVATLQNADELNGTFFSV